MNFYACVFYLSYNSKTYFYIFRFRCVGKLIYVLYQLIMQ